MNVQCENDAIPISRLYLASSHQCSTTLLRTLHYERDHFHLNFMGFGCNTLFNSFEISLAMERNCFLLHFLYLCLLIRLKIPYFIPFFSSSFVSFGARINHTKLPSYGFVLSVAKLNLRKCATTPTTNTFATLANCIAIYARTLNPLDSTNIPQVAHFLRDSNQTRKQNVKIHSGREIASSQCGTRTYKIGIRK